MPRSTGSKSASERFPGFDRLYEIAEANWRAFRVDLETEEEWAITRQERRPRSPVVAKWAMGARTPPDVIWTTLAIPVLISDRVAQLLVQLGARGWSTYKVKLSGKDGERIKGFQGLSVHGRCGPIDDSKCVRVLRRYPGGLIPVLKGMYFDPLTWDGSHIFMSVEPRGSIFVVDEVKAAFKKARVTNMAFERLDQLERDEEAESSF